MKPIAAVASAVLLACSSAALAPAAHADDDAKINARIEVAGRACKNAVAVKVPKASMAEISVELGATLKQSIDAGQFTLNDIKKQGLSFNWTARKHSGYCNTDGSGAVTELVKQQ
jgi:type 1 fimbria pilin